MPPQDTRAEGNPSTNKNNGGFGVTGHFVISLDELPQPIPLPALVLDPVAL